MQYGRLVDCGAAGAVGALRRPTSSKQLRDVSVASRINKPIGDKMIMNAAFLISRDQEGGVRREGQARSPARFEQAHVQVHRPVAAVQLRQHPAEAGDGPSELSRRCSSSTRSSSASCGSCSTRSSPPPRPRCRTTRRCASSCSRRRCEHELGETTDEEFAEIERDVLARIREIKGGRQTRRDLDVARAPRVELESFDDEPKTANVHLLRRQRRRRQDDLRRGARGRRISARPRACSPCRPIPPIRSATRWRAACLRGSEAGVARGSLNAVELDAPARVRALDRRAPRRARRRSSSMAPGSIATISTRCSRCRFPASTSWSGMLEIVSLATGLKRALRADRRRRHTISSSSIRRRPAIRFGCWPRRTPSRPSPPCSTRCEEEHRIIRREFGRIGRPEAADRLIDLLARASRATPRALLRDPRRTAFEWVMLPEELSLDGNRRTASRRCGARRFRSPRSSSTACCRPGAPCPLCDRRRAKSGA